VRAPQKIVRQLLLARAAEGRHRDAERPRPVEHFSNRAVLAARVRALQDDEQGAPPFREQPVLQDVDGFGILRRLRLRALLVGQARLVARVALA
jgi:hypothetical protein